MNFYFCRACLNARMGGGVLDNIGQVGWLIPVDSVATSGWSKDILKSSKIVGPTYVRHQCEQLLYWE